MNRIYNFLTIAALILSTHTFVFAQQARMVIPNEIHLQQNPYNPMNILLIPSAIEGLSAQNGDLILAFDGGICVGAGTITNIDELLNIVATSSDHVNKGFNKGSTIRLELHSISENIIYELSPEKIILGSMNYESLGTLYAIFKADALSVDENITKNNFSVYPNPVGSQLHIVTELTDSKPNETIQLKLINIEGKILISSHFPLSQKTNTINLSSLSAGEYTLLLSTTDIHYTKKIIKQ